MSRSSRRAGLRRVWLSSLCAIGGLKVATRLAGLAVPLKGVEWQRESGVSDGQRAIVILASCALFIYLLLGARRDERVEHLSVLFLMVAVFFATPPIWAPAKTLPGPGASLGRLLLR